jgi:hypothetical protein
MGNKGMMQGDSYSGYSMNNVPFNYGYDSNFYSFDNMGSFMNNPNPNYTNTSKGLGSGLGSGLGLGGSFFYDKKP